MGTYRRIGWTFALCMAVAAISIVSGCGGSTESATSEQPPVDPRFATAEALLEHFNQVSTTGPAVDVHEILSLFYAETAWQKLIMRIRDITIPSLQLDQACWEAFGQGMYPDASEPPLAPNRERAVMTEVTGERAMATQRENDGTQYDLYLVKYNNRWWVSGYTLEYDPEFYSTNNLLDPNNGDDLDRVERAVDHVAVAAGEVLARLRAGDFASVEEVREAHADALIKYAMNNPQKLLGDRP